MPAAVAVAHFMVALDMAVVNVAPPGVRDPAGQAPGTGDRPLDDRPDRLQGASS